MTYILGPPLLNPLAGAAALGLEHALGNFEVGKQFDAVIVQCEAGAYETWETLLAEADGVATPQRSLAADFERYVNLGDDRNVKEVWRGPALGGPGTYRFLRYMCFGTFYASL